MDPDELMRRFDERVEDKIEEEKAELRVSRCILFNQQDLLQRTLTTASHVVARDLGLALESVGVDIKVDHEQKKIMPLLVVSVSNLDEVSVSEEDAQRKFEAAFVDVNEEWAPLRHALHEAARVFPIGDPMSVSAFQDAVAAWAEHH